MHYISFPGRKVHINTEKDIFLLKRMLFFARLLLFLGPNLRCPIFVYLAKDWIFADLTDSLIFCPSFVVEELAQGKGSGR